MLTFRGQTLGPHLGAQSTSFCRAAIYSLYAETDFSLPVTARLSPRNGWQARTPGGELTHTAWANNATWRTRRKVNLNTTSLCSWWQLRLYVGLPVSTPWFKRSKLCHLQVGRTLAHHPHWYLLSPKQMSNNQVHTLSHWDCFSPAPSVHLHLQIQKADDGERQQPCKWT